MALRVITPTHIWVFKSYVYYAKTTIHSNGLLNCTASKRGPSSNACASRRAQCRTRTVGAQYAHKTRCCCKNGWKRENVSRYTYWRAQGDYAQYRAFTVVDFHVLPRYPAPCTGARARVIAQNIAYHFTRRTFPNNIITEIARCVEFCHISSGWFDYTEPSLSGVQGANVLVRGVSSTSNLFEPSRTTSLQR